MDTNIPKLFVRQPNSHNREERFTDPAGLSSPTINPVFGSLFQLSHYLRRKFDRISRHNVEHDAQAAGDVIIKELQVQALLIGNVETDLELLTEIIQKGMNLKQERPTGFLETLMFNVQAPKDRLKHLYKTLIMAYTAETFLYKHINQVLRSGKWEQIDSLVAYLYHLAEAWEEFSLNVDTIQFKQENSMYSEIKQGIIPDLVLYRGIMLKKDQVAQYDPKTCDKFSWNGITSTSIDKRVATSFVKKKPSKDECSVLFTILYYKKPGKHYFLQFCDISQDSMVPEEKEVLVVPGTVFKLIDTHKEGEIYHITLEVLNEEIRDSKATSLYSLEDLQVKVNERSRQLEIGRLDKDDIKQVIDMLSKGNDITDEIKLRVCSFGPDNMARLLKTFQSFSNLQLLTLSCDGSKFWTPEIAQTLTQNFPESRKVSLFLDLFEYTSSINVIHEIVSSGIYKKLNTFLVSLHTFSDITKRFNVMKELAKLPEGALTELVIVDFSSEQDEDLLATFWALLAAIGFVHLTISNKNIQTNNNTKSLCNLIAIGKIKHLYIRYRRKFDLDTLQLICDTLPECALETFWICKCNGVLAKKKIQDFGYKGIDILASALEGSSIKSLGLFGVREDLESIVRLMYMIPFTNIKNIYLNVQLLQESSTDVDIVTDRQKVDIIKTLAETLHEIIANLQEAIVYGSLGSGNTFYERVVYSFNGQPIEIPKTEYPELDNARKIVLKKLQDNKDKKENSIDYSGSEDHVLKRMRFDSWMFSNACYIVPWEEDFDHDEKRLGI